MFYGDVLIVWTGQALRARKILIKRAYMKYLHYEAHKKNDRLN